MNPYGVVTAADSETLIRAVNEMAAKGYEPIGAPFYSPHFSPPFAVWVQAMFKRDAKPQAKGK